jgi:acyl-CoA reductase-like NAD-dependent aldehyde dehydrogenase
MTETQTTPLRRRAIAPSRLSNFIGGEFVAPASGEYFDDINPSTEEPIAEVPDSDGKDVDRAVAAARKAFPAWSLTATTERSSCSCGSRI